MKLRLWPPKNELQPAPPLVVLNASTQQREQWKALTSEAHIHWIDAIPTSGDYVLALPPDRERPPGVPAHIPIIDSTAADLARLLKAALLYLEAHRSIKQ